MIILKVNHGSSLIWKNIKALSRNSSYFCGINRTLHFSWAKHKFNIFVRNYEHKYLPCLHGSLYHSKSGVYGNRPQHAKKKFTVASENIENQIANSNLYRLITAYRQHGHRVASINPISNNLTDKPPELDESNYGIDVKNNSLILLKGLLTWPNKSEASHSEIIEFLRKTYCGSISVEYQHLEEEEEREWFKERFENLMNTQHLSNEEKINLGKELIKSQVFDNFLATKFSTVKRYGGEGAESMMGFFTEIFKLSAQCGISSIVIGMPHRGRLNLLTGLLDFPPVLMFQKMKGMPEFPDNLRGTGDVLSHLTSSIDLKFGQNAVHVTMLPNPSHLEAVCPVAVGYARACLQSLKLGNYAQDVNNSSNNALALQIHGDAAFSAQGVIMETLAMANAPHFTVGGSVHLVVNNGLGFTTPADCGRSSLYCSDVMKMIQSPIIHVNGDFPEELVKATRLAFEYRHKFNKDILIDLNCYRQWGHNELDDPTFTNPTMYKIIHSRKSVPDLYTAKLIDENVWSREEADTIIKSHSAFLNYHFKQIDSYKPQADHLTTQWKGFVQAPEAVSVWDTGFPIDTLKFIGAKSVEIPNDFTIHPNLNRVLIIERLKKIQEGTSLDWATAETLAIGSLLYQGHNVRISGQDVGRGTFSHRHAMLVNQDTDEIYIPLNHIIENQTAYYEVSNSILSEEAVLGFEYGMSIVNLNNLVIWEAQFGDFYNGAQIMFDTFISSGELKWLLQSGLVILLPHGYDGAGPEHSSCHMERFLQMSDSKEDAVDGDDVNWHIVNPTTSAQYFHLLRRQMMRNFRKPLIVVAPKILLRLPSAMSSLNDMAPGTSFSPVLGDKSVDPAQVKKVLLCSGKHYYLLYKEREARNQKDVAIIRLESLCPFPSNELSKELIKYKKATNYVWCQEEHQNMGPWSFIKVRFENLLNCQLRYAGRKPLGTAAVGIGHRHQEEIQEFLKSAFS